MPNYILTGKGGVYAAVHAFQEAMREEAQGWRIQGDGRENERYNLYNNSGERIGMFSQNGFPRLTLNGEAPDNEQIIGLSIRSRLGLAQQLKSPK